MEPMKYEVAVAQEEAELSSLIDIFKRENVKSYLEIGARYGGSFWRIVKSMPVGSAAIAVDLPAGFGGRKDGEVVLRACIKELCNIGYNAQAFYGDSKSKEVIDQVKAFAPFDAVFIDADHTLPAVTADWQNYGQMGRIVAFHDIAWARPATYTGSKIEVPKFWNQIKVNYRHEEFKTCHTGHDNGIGVLWRS